MGLTVTIAVDELERLNKENKDLETKILMYKEVIRSKNKSLYKYELEEWKKLSDKDKKAKMKDHCSCCRYQGSCSVLSKYEKEYMFMPYLDEETGDLKHRECTHFEWD